MTGRSSAAAHPLTVLMTADTVGGVWSYAVGLCTSLPEFRFVVATMGPRPNSSQREAIRRLPNAVLAESDYRLEWMADGGSDFSESCAWLEGLIEAHDIDVVHVNGYAHACLGADWPLLAVAHSDVLSWWHAVYGCGAPPEWDGYRRRVVTGLAAASRIVAPSAAVLRDLEHHYLRLGSNAAVIPNGIEVAALRRLPKRPIVLAAGRLWDAAKNLAALDAAAAGLAWPVEIAGAAEHPEGGTANFANARLLGRLDPREMAHRLRSASIFAAPARYEPFGLAILEAAAAGCALVLGDVPSLRENWKGAAVFVDPQDSRALRSAINRLIADTEERDRLAAAARRRACCFTRQRMAQTYAALYRDMARHRARLEIA